VAAPGDALPGRATQVADAKGVGLNDQGVVTFDATGSKDPSTSAYRWEKGTISLLAASGTEIPDLGKGEGFWAFGPNNQNGNVWLNTWTKEIAPSAGLVLWQAGQLLPVIFAGQELPGGGRYKGDGIDWGRPSKLGQYPFVARVEEKGVIGTGAYRIDADGKLSLIARTGMTTPLGTLTRISPALTNTASYSFGIGINPQGQVALTARIDNGSDAILLLTPQNPTGSSSP
jgi:hypothetical protein